MLTCLTVDPNESTGELRDEAEERIAQARAICALAASSADESGFINDLDRRALTAAETLLGQAERLFGAAKKVEQQVGRGRITGAGARGAMTVVSAS